jgi:actin-related protein 2
MAALAAGGGASEVVVVDNGTGFLKAGFAADNLPRFSFPSIVGRPVLRAEEDVLGDDVVLKDVMVGDEAAAVRQALEISYPLENGVIRNWDDMEVVWSYLFRDKMRLDAAAIGERKVLLTEAPMNPKENRRRMIEVMMERYGWGAMQVGIQAMLTLYAQGLLTGLVLDSGDGVTHVVAVYDGFVPQHLTRRLDVAGRHITRYLIKLLLLRGYAFNRTADFQTVAEIKEKLCYVALEAQKERALAQETTVLMETYALPDGRKIHIGRERFEAAEALFHPSLVDVESLGMSDLVFDVIQKAEQDIRPDLYKAIVLSGGTTMYPGLPSRLEFDLRALYLRDVLRGDKSRAGRLKLNIVDDPQRKHMVFLGASVLGDIMASREDFWITKAMYAEEGAARLVEKFSSAKTA